MEKRFFLTKSLKRKSFIQKININLLFHVYQRQETTPRNFWFPNAEHRRLFKIKNKQKI